MVLSEELALYISGALTFVVTLAVAARRKHNAARYFLLKNLPVEDDVWRRAERFVETDLHVTPGIPLFDVLYSAFKRDEKTCDAVLKLKPTDRFENLREAIAWVKEKVPTLRKQTGHKFLLEEKFFELMKSGEPRKELHAVASGGVLGAISEGEPANVSSHGLSEVGDFADYVPLATLVYSAMKNSKQVLKKQKNVKTAAGHLLLDTAGRGLASFGGAKAGFYLGTSLLPFAPFAVGASAVIIPATTTVIGSILGNFGGKGLVKYIKDRPVRVATAALLQKSGQFFAVYEAKFSELTAIASAPYEERKALAVSKMKGAQSWFGRAFLPSVPVKFFVLAQYRLDQEIRGIEKFYKALLSKGRRMGRKKGGLLLFGQGKTILLNDPTLLASYEEVEKALDLVELTRKKAA